MRTRLRIGLGARRLPGCRAVIVAGCGGWRTDWREAIDLAPVVGFIPRFFGPRIRPVTASDARTVERRSVMPRRGRISQARCPQSPRPAPGGGCRQALRRLELPQDTSPIRAIRKPQRTRRDARFACDARAGRAATAAREIGVGDAEGPGDDRDPVRVACVEGHAVAACGAIRMGRAVRRRFALP